MLITRRESIPYVPSSTEIYHLTVDELNRLTEVFQDWFEQKRSKLRGKYWLTFLFLRYTGARISEILNIDETRDIDFRNSTVRLITLKRTLEEKRTI